MIRILLILVLSLFLQGEFIGSPGSGLEYNIPNAGSLTAQTVMRWNEEKRLCDWLFVIEDTTGETIGQSVYLRLIGPDMQAVEQGDIAVLQGYINQHNWVVMQVTPGNHKTQVRINAPCREIAPDVRRIWPKIYIPTARKR